MELFRFNAIAKQDVIEPLAEYFKSILHYWYLIMAYNGRFFCREARISYGGWS